MSDYISESNIIRTTTHVLETFSNNQIKVSDDEDPNYAFSAHCVLVAMIFLE